MHFKVNFVCNYFLCYNNKDLFQIDLIYLKIYCVRLDNFTGNGCWFKKNLIF